jgi:hypothetical protein
VVTGKIGMASDTYSSGHNGCPNNCQGGSQDTSRCVSGGIEFNLPSAYTGGSFPAPTCTSNRGDLTVGGTTSITAPASPGVACYSSISLNSGKLTLGSGSYVVTGNLNLNGGAELHINGTVKLWVANAPSPNSKVTVQSNNPNDFWLIYNGTGDVNNNTNNDFTGVFFAPEAKVNVNYKIKGAVIGGSVTLNSGASVGYDSRLCQ